MGVADRSMLRMEKLPNKMSSSSLLHPVGRDYRQPRARDHGKVSTVDWLAKNRGPPSLEACVYTLDNFLVLCHKRNDFHFLISLRI